MNSERDVNQSRPLAEPGDVVVKLAHVEAMRQVLHELANIFTGLSIAGGLLCEQLEHTSLGRFASGLYGDCERGRRLVRELRAQLPVAGDEQPGAPGYIAAAQDRPAEPEQSQTSPGAARGDGEDRDRRQR